MDELKRIRLLRGLSQDDLAKASEVSEFTISEVEKGRRPNVRPSTGRKLARALDVEVADLYGERVVSPKARAPLSEDGERRGPAEGDLYKVQALEQAWWGLAELSAAYLAEPTPEGMSLVAKTAASLSQYTLQDEHLKAVDFSPEQLKGLQKAFNAVQEVLRRASQEGGVLAPEADRAAKYFESISEPIRNA